MKPGQLVREALQSSSAFRAAHTAAPTRALRGRKRGVRHDTCTARCLHDAGAPVATASCSFSFQCFAMFSASGSSGLGALNSAWMLQGAKSSQLKRHAMTRVALQCKHLRSTVRICSAGLHLSFKMSRQMRPSWQNRNRVIRRKLRRGRDSLRHLAHLVDVWVVDFGQESDLLAQKRVAGASKLQSLSAGHGALAHLGRRHGVLFGQEELEFVHAACGSRRSGRGGALRSEHRSLCPSRACTCLHTAIATAPASGPGNSACCLPTATR